LLASAFEQDAARTGSVARASHLAPGLAINFADPAAACALRKEVDLRMQFRYGYRNHIPEVFGEDVGHDEIDFTAGVATIVAPTLDRIVRVRKTSCGFDLNTPKVVSGVEDEVVALALAPCFGNTEAQASGFGQKGGFDGFPTRFARGEADGVNFCDLAGRRRLRVGGKIKARPVRPRFFVSLFLEYQLRGSK